MMILPEKKNLNFIEKFFQNFNLKNLRAIFIYIHIYIPIYMCSK